MPRYGLWSGEQLPRQDPGLAFTIPYIMFMTIQRRGDSDHLEAAVGPMTPTTSSCRMLVPLNLLDLYARNCGNIDCTLMFWIKLEGGGYQTEHRRTSDPCLLCSLH